MRVLALDISTKTGWAVLEGDLGSVPKLVEHGRVALDAKIRGYGDLAYPWDYMAGIEKMAFMIADVAGSHNVDRIVIEETNGSKSRYTQKILEWLHYCTLGAIRTRGVMVSYINTSDWRRAVGATLTKEDKKLNVKVRALKKKGDKAGLKTLGARGKIGKKHVAVRYANNTFGLALRMKDNDAADAICLGTSYFLGVPDCTGE